MALKFKQKRLPVITALIVAGILLTLFPLLHSRWVNTSAANASSTTQWTQYLYSDLHQGWNPFETHLSASNIASLKQLWAFKSAGNMPAEPVVVNGVVYEGDWNGHMYAVNATTGVQIWMSQLVVNASTTCPVYRRGVSASPVVNNGVVYVGSGNIFYALNATDGSIIWQKTLGTSGTMNDILYGPEAFGNGKIYIGTSSLCDHPLTQGMLYALNIADGSIAAQAAMVPNGKLGAGIWYAPTLDAATGSVIVTTGSVAVHRPIAMQASIVSLDWNTLAVKQFWQVPPTALVADADFGCTPTIFPGPVGKTYVGCINKNSIYYVFDEANLNTGPVWQVQLGPGGDKGGVQGSVASAAYEGGVLYIQSALATINGTSYASSIGAFNALNGAQIWRFGVPGSISATPVLANGLLYDTEGTTMEVRDMATGTVLFSQSFTGKLYGSVTVVNGVVYVSAMNWRIYAFTA